MKNLIALMMISLMPCVASAAFFEQGQNGMYETKCFSVKKNKKARFAWTLDEQSSLQANSHSIFARDCKTDKPKGIKVYRFFGGKSFQSGTFKVKGPGKFYFIVVSSAEDWTIQQVK